MTAQRTQKRRSITLPRSSDGKKIKEHPLIYGWSRFRVKNPEVSIRSFAQSYLDVKPQAFHGWLTGAMLDRDFLVPAERVPDLCRALNVEPWLFRPDIWERGWKFRSSK